MERNGYLHCPMCGMEFKRADTACAHGCPMGAGCNLVRCPSCRYEFPPETPVVSWVRRLLRRSKKPSGDDAVTLDSLRAGEQARLAGLRCANASRRNTLSVFGMVPGAEVTLLQRHPSFVVRVGQTELGMDAEIAREILVEPR